MIKQKFISLKNKLSSAKDKLVLGSSVVASAVLTTAVNASAAETTLTIDYAGIANSAKSSIFEGINAILPVVAGIFGTILAIKFAPRLIKWFVRG